MFPSAFFAPVYFAPRYWERPTIVIVVGTGVVVRASDRATVKAHKRAAITPGTRQTVKPHKKTT